jgi:lysophospholipase L1-like esterase
MKIVCIGSDNTRGFPIDTKQCWVSLWERSSGFEIINMGESGSTAEHMIYRFKADVLDQNPSVVLIITGTTDFIHYGKSPQEVMDLVLTMVKTSKDHGIKPIVVTPIMIDIPHASRFMAGDSSIDYDAINDSLKNYRDLIISTAKDGGYDVWDFQTKFEEAIKGKGDRASYYVDGIHPGLEAHMIVASIALGENL